MSGQKSSERAQRAQVFIATTNGLVQVQSILKLPDHDVSSVATIDSTSELAGISSAYQTFVEKPQGIITSVFGGSAYRLNLSNGIDQGDSWQLGVFIAHYLFEFDCLSSTNQSSQAINSTLDDIILIATGRVDTVSGKVLSIDALTKKCLTANKQISQWQAQGKDICFFVPSLNFRQPVPDSATELTAIGSLQDLHYFCKNLNLPVFELPVLQSLGSETAHDRSEAVIIEADVLPPKDTFTRNQPVDNVDTLLNAKYIKFGAAGLLAILLMLWLFLNTSKTLPDQLGDIKQGQYQGVMSGNQTRPIAFALIAEFSENKKSCSTASPVVIEEGSLNGSKNLSRVNLNHLCALYLLSSNDVGSLWFVTDTKAVFQLRPILLKESGVSLHPGLLAADTSDLVSRKWLLPIPKNQSQTRQYTLLAFTGPSDAADLRSLESYLASLHKEGRAHSIDDLQIWIDKTQSNNTVRMLSQELSLVK
jgi:hypothetical protein